MITPEEIARMRELATQALVDGEFEVYDNDTIIIRLERFAFRVITENVDMEVIDYLVAAANALPALLDEIERLQAQLRAETLHFRDALSISEKSAQAWHEDCQREVEANKIATADLAAALKRAEMLQEALIGIVGIIPPAMAKKWPNNMARADAALKAGAK